MKLTLDYPPVWLALALGAAIAMGRIWPMPLPFDDGLGWLLVVAGLALMAWAALHMLRARATVDPHGQPSTLVTDGPFGLTRNPIYVGDALVLAGTALIAHAPLALFLVPAFAAVITRRFIVHEEARLTDRFGNDFVRYAGRVRRWL